MGHNKLLLQMFLTASFAAVASALVIYVAVQIQLENALFKNAKQSLESQSVFAKEVAREFLEVGTFPAGHAWAEDTLGISTRVSIIRMDGTVVFDSGQPIAELDNHRNRPELLQAASKGRGEATRFSQTLGYDLLYIALRLDGEDGPIGYVRLASATNLIADDLNAIERQLVLVILITLAVVFVISFLLSRRFYQPIAAATVYARQIAEGNYKLRLPGRTEGAVGALERSLNELARKTEDRMDRIVESRNQLEAILSGLEEGVLALDKNEAVAHINLAAIQLLNLGSDAVGKKVWEVIRVAKVHSMLDAALQGNTESDNTLVVNDRTLEVSILAMNAVGESHDGVILVFQDITERSRLDKIRSDFVANASHELKTPLAAIKGIVETIIDDEEMPTEVQRNFFGRVLAQTNRLNKIVLDLMQLSRFDSYRDQKVNRKRVDMYSVLRQVYSAFKTTADDAEVELVLIADQENDAETKGKVMVLGDSEALSQLMANLVLNAIKYSHKKTTVTIRMTCERDYALVRVEDQGIGISAAEQQRIFERFYRVDPARSRELGGTGLGLSIVKHIADLHDGSVQVSSEEGKGSVFTVRLPIIA
jgi:two-component system phosphate regulon sensor histidine kinase PhoR